MKSSTVALGLGAAAAVSAQRPADQSICDYYTTALLMENNATNQQTVLTLVVNTAVIGNYTSNPGSLVAVPGILAPGTGDFEGVNLLPYFNGELVSTNAGGMPRSVNFLDDGGAAPLMMNMPANGTDSAQYRLLTHLYSYFAVLLGCSEFGNSTGQYAGETSQYSVHQYMALSNAEVGYFITQVGLAAASFGVTEEDVTAVGTALTDAFGYRCAPPAAIPPTASAELQAICIAEDCPIATASPTCEAYEAVVEPATATMSSMPTESGMESGSGSMPSATMSGMPEQSTGGAGSLLPVMGGVVGGALAAVFAL
ncbi:hypothetical protein CERZMDRAFT_46514 [Cercospora zeae-maydis SCOH1-5]|uniref:Heme haloperoxidase family profile domain-containing protein n=1 Tax=Cercospora zeae-maydis SCOH1-5 TaxID=717836 RepID=A0A6A6F860_9PEZI|nr:hypothetical protein CERZMDRAFT_46514 [Cercospora zeae-maydis SCOH1-5]